MMSSLIRIALAGWLALASAHADPASSSGKLPRLPPKEVAEAQTSFVLRPGFRIEPVATEPLIADPIAIAFDPDGVLYVVEMRGYSERREDALGRVSRLIDEDGDGRYEKATVFLEGLKWPTGVICWDGGIFVAVTPDILYCADTDGDGAADITRVAFTGFGEGAARELNVQALVNSLTWGPDGRIFGSTARNGGMVRRPDDPAENALNLRGADFSFDPRTLELRAEPGTAQYGLTFDHFGQRYVCSNSRHLIAVMYGWPWNGIGSLPNALVDIPVDGPAAEVFRASEVEPWRVLRTRWRVQGRVGGPIEGGGRASGYFTSASGLAVYRGHAFPPDFHGNVFVGDVGSNLVHRKIIERPDDRVQPVARRAEDEQEREFLTSTDNWFRPVQCANGPDGALYIVDMYREVIEHPKSLPPGIKEQLDLNSGNGRGRIWRVVPDAFERPVPLKLTELPEGRLKRLSEHGNGWTRDAATQVLHASGKEASQEAETWPARKRFEEALVQLKDPDAATLQRLLREGAGDPWIGRTVAEAARRSDLIGEVFGNQEDIETAARWLRSIRFTRPGADDARMLRPLLDRARTMLESPDAIWLTGIDPETTVEQLWEIVDRADSKTAVIALEAIRRRDSKWPADVLSRWSRLPAEARAFALANLPPARLATGIEQGAIDPREISIVQRQSLRKTGDRELRARLEKLLGQDPVISREDALAKFRPAARMKGNAGAGATIFNARCATCHVSHGGGSVTGPPVDSFRRMGVPMLLENIIHPNREVAPQYFVWEATLRDGSVQTGILARETPDRIVLRQTGGINIPIARHRIVKLVNTNLSLMPPGLEAELNLQQMANLLAYLAEG